ncbi:sigma-54-dependent transcriptional regulator [Chrysiogenes arsenatis]|uniref:sigma-54-dependent transcriptional regulator n=1 Tax=Chrysiogenes arsenatis TaxID=309797 RepID=UPI0004024511|nr:sigma-54 dependent transcriptional regulator [Chrysiogenes arsenatis]
MPNKALMPILVVDDQLASLDSICRALSKKGYTVAQAATLGEAKAAFLAHSTPVVVTDLHLPDGTGIDFLKFIKQQDETVEVILITAFASVETAVDAMKQGAFDYVTKPVNLTELRRVVAAAWDKAMGEDDEEAEIQENSGQPPLTSPLLGESPDLREVREKIISVASTRASVLILGESGTGKELIAQSIHDYSDRAKQPFVGVNCSAFPETLLESELFGHEKGAFAGAYKQHHGKFEQAHRGTLFLDEIGEIPMTVQVKLLRVLENREIVRIGGRETIPVDVRIIAATHRDLAEEVEAGHFREDLYYRLKVVVITAPPLRHHPEDIPLLANHFVQHFAAENGRDIQGISSEALAILGRYPWRGNVRELRNCLENMVIFASSHLLTPRDIPEEYRQETYEADEIPTEAAPKQTMEDIEREAIEQTLQQVGGNRTQAARILGIGLRTLQRKIKQYDL